MSIDMITALKAPTTETTPTSLLKKNNIDLSNLLANNQNNQTNQAEAHLELGLALAQAGSHEGAIDAYQRVIKLKPDWVDAYALLGVSLQIIGKLDEAINIYQEAIKLNPHNAQSLANLGVILHSVKKSEEAIQLLQQAISINPNFPEAFANLGVILREQGKIEEAVSMFHQAIDLKPNYAEAHGNLGFCLYQQNKLTEAATSLKVATVLNPSYADAYVQLGIVMHGLGSATEAVIACRNAINLGIETVDIYLNMGVALQDLGKQEDTIAAYNRAISINPQSADAYSNLGVVFLEQSKYDEAISAFKKAIELNSNHPHASSNLSIALHEKGDDDEAGRRYEEAIRLTPDNPDIYSNFAMARLHQRKFPEALELFAKAAKLNQDHGKNLGNKIEVPLHRIKHDLEQMRHLKNKNLLRAEFKEYSDYLESIENKLLTDKDAKKLAVEGADIAKIAPSYNRLVYIPVEQPIPEHLLNPQLNIAEIEQSYLQSKPEIIYIDNFLAPETLEAIRNFCHEATVWKKEYPNGYLGATLKDGFASNLIMQIAEQLRTTFPNIFKSHLLEQAWAFKYDSTMKGINIHADFAAVNVNFWITRSEACLSKDNGGLIIWDKESPKEWNFQTYNGNEPAIRKFISQSGAKAVRVPYRENRCVIFNSTLFHETDHFEFNDAYIDRRINVTMLYGKGLSMR